MPACVSCGSEVPIGSRFCPSCGMPVGSDEATLASGAEATAASDAATLASAEVAAAASGKARSARPSSKSSSRPPSSAAFSLSEGRFLPGRLIAGRYRIIALLGKGGMGEVYRADDLTLGQPVALKFLPEEASRDEALLERFRNEVRIARRVSHPNVCRVYDVGEVEGHSFFTMEYVDGEDLASLLRRIGRLPQDKAIEIARQLCAGLAAAHAKGVLHRDLKPANIMLDGRGQVVITDFGLAGLNDQIAGADIRSGTPAYMSPEQLAGKEVSSRSDIYALGLVLYEIFTGKRAFTAETLAEVVRTRGEVTPSRPSSVVKDLDPAVERVILRCLEPEPAHRPASVLSVVAALPGGDPLAAALAAGETPSPQMVAAAGETTGLSPRTAIICFLALLIALAAGIYLMIRDNGLAQMGLEQSPDVLAQKARELIRHLGYTERPVDSGVDLDYDTDFVDSVEKDEKQARWPEILGGQPSVVRFWYRQSPRYMIPNDFQDLALTPGMLTMNDPPPTLSGMVNVGLDAQGRLFYFQAIPAQKESGNSPSSPSDWSSLFAAAGLDMSQFQAAPPAWNSLASSDARAAWNGNWPGTNRPLHVEAAALHGKPVYFSMIGNWQVPNRMNPANPTISTKVSQTFLLILFLSMMIAGTLLARRHYRLGRGDRPGALRLAYTVFVIEILLCLLRSHLPPSMETFGTLVLAISTALFVSGVVWIIYMALEPYVRRYWPKTVISWSRLLSGQWRDALVGRDVLFGVMLGVLWILIFQLRSIPMMHRGAAPQLPSSEALLGGRLALGAWLRQFEASIVATLQFFFMLLGLKVILRRDWLAGATFVAIFAVMRSLGNPYPTIVFPTMVLIYAIAAIIVVRFGLVPLVCAIFTVDMLGNVPFTSDLSAWYMNTSIFALLSVVALAAWGFYTSLGGAPLWKTEA